VYIDIIRNEDALTAETYINIQLEEFYSKEVYREEENRFGCGLCSKMFRGTLFVQKHIQNKHEAQLDKAKEKGIIIQYQKNYENDTNHITPSDVYSSGKEDFSQIYQNYYKQQKEKKEKEDQERDERRRDYYSRKNSSSYRKDNYRSERKYDNQNHQENNRDRKLVDYADIATDWDKPKERPVDIDYEKSLHEFIPRNDSF